MVYEGLFSDYLIFSIPSFFGNWNTEILFGRKANNLYTVIVSRKDVCFLTRYINRPYFSDLPPYRKPVKRFTGKIPVSLINKHRPKICIIPSHLNIVIVVVACKKNIRQIIIIRVNYLCVAVRG